MSRPRASSPSSGLPIDWSELVPLRLRARMVAEGGYAGAHRSVRKGAGVELGVSFGVDGERSMRKTLTPLTAPDWPPAGPL